MSVVIEPPAREHLRTELLRHRSKFDLTDAAYVRDVLRISLNTYKKCVASGESTALSLNRQTCRNLVRNAGLRVDDLGLAIAPARSDASLGSYAARDYLFMCNRYVLYRRSFLHAKNLNRSVLEISVDADRDCLQFSETENYVSDLGLPHDQTHVGDVHVDRDRSVLSLLGNQHGRVRLMLLGVPQQVIGREGLRMRGVLLTHGRPRGFWQPTVASLYVEELPDPQARTGDLCGTIDAGWEGYERISGELRNVEEYATVDTALLWRTASR